MSAFYFSVSPEKQKILLGELCDSVVKLSIQFFDHIRFDLLERQNPGTAVIFFELLGVFSGFERNQFFPHGTEDVAADDKKRTLCIDLLHVVILCNVNRRNIRCGFAGVVLLEIEEIFEEVFGTVEKISRSVVENDLSDPVWILIDEHPAHRAFVLFGRLQWFDLARECNRMGDYQKYECNENEPCPHEIPL
jgi:hypothetical protein